MIYKTRLLVCGDSLYMAGIAASLHGNPALELVRVGPDAAGLLRCLDEIAPAAIAFDMDETPAGLAIELLRDHPGILLIALNPDTDAMLIVSGRQWRIQSAAELADVIDGIGSSR